MMYPNLTVADNPLLVSTINEMRDREMDTATFIHRMNAVAEMLAYESGRLMEYGSANIQSPIMDKPEEMPVIAETQPALISIMRAGNVMVGPFRKFFPYASQGFMQMHRDEKTFQPVFSSAHLPLVKDKTVFVLDPMLATGGSINKALAVLKTRGAIDRKIKVISVVASPEGIRNVIEEHPRAQILVGYLDKGLTLGNYIYPGMGDVGDRLFGEKI